MSLTRCDGTTHYCLGFASAAAAADDRLSHGWLATGKRVDCRRRVHCWEQSCVEGGHVVGSRALPRRPSSGLRGWLPGRAAIHLRIIQNIIRILWEHVLVAYETGDEFCAALAAHVSR